MTDHLTSKDGVEFWHRYFADHTNNNVHIDTFCEAIESEFSTTVFTQVFDGLAQDNVNEDDILADFYTDIQNKVSIDQEFVSLNALELFTRKNGLRKAIQNLLEECATRHRA